MELLQQSIKVVPYGHDLSWINPGKNGAVTQKPKVVAVVTRELQLSNHTVIEAIFQINAQNRSLTWKIV